MAIPVVATGWVVGAIFHATADDADLDRLAQAAVNVGTVTFTPATGYHLASTTQAITHGTIVALLDSHGDLHPQRTSSDPRRRPGSSPRTALGRAGCARTGTCRGGVPAVGPRGGG